ncbi:hypothetical protein PR048_009872 [Dryococelus australis]|uniref:Large ribosomal subunit protein mL54 n=1 Tax=Dryococelus australis TaxID=614101 RepID=A0ABQ9I233_9NEOP|nr:hypothetical protein PR048_009872 [Dryococelus australis]
MEHDIAYHHHKGLAERHVADKELEKKAFKILLSSDADLNERLWAGVTGSAMHIKRISSFGKSKKKLGKLGPMVEKKVLPVETDPHKLVNFVCGSNLMKEGSDVPIKPDSEYPDWLWNLHTGKPLPLEELESDPKRYWRRLRKMALRKNSTMKKLNPF